MCKYREILLCVMQEAAKAEERIAETRAALEAAQHAAEVHIFTLSVSCHSKLSCNCSSSS